MATQKKRIQSFLDDTTFTALQEFAQDQGLTLSSAVEKIVIQFFQGEQSSEYKSEQILKDIENRLISLEHQFKAWKDSEQPSEYKGEQVSEYNSEYKNEINNHSSSEQSSEYVICYLVDGNITGYWGKETDEAKCDWMTEMSQANTYDKESIVKREATKLKKKFRNLDIRYNTIVRLKLLGHF